MFNPPYVDMTTSLVDAARASGSASIITLTKHAGLRWIIYAIQFGYRTAPTNGLLTIAANGTTVFSMPVTAAGAGPMLFRNPRLLPSITDGQTYTITLADGTAIKDLCVEALETQVW